MLNLNKLLLVSGLVFSGSAAMADSGSFGTQIRMPQKYVVDGNPFVDIAVVEVPSKVVPSNCQGVDGFCPPPKILESIEVVQVTIAYVDLTGGYADAQSSPKYLKVNFLQEEFSGEELKRISTTRSHGAKKELAFELISVEQLSALVKEKVLDQSLSACTWSDDFYCTHPVYKLMDVEQNWLQFSKRH